MPLFAILPLIASAITTITGALATVGATLSTAGTAVVGALTNISTAVGAFIETNLPVVLENINKLDQYVDIYTKIGKKFKLIDDETSLEIGDKVLQAQDKGIRADKFSHYEEYVSAINKFEIDENLSDKFSSQEKSIMALLYIVGGLENKGVKNINMIGELGHKNISSENIVKYALADSVGKIDLAQVNAYLSGDLRGKERTDMKSLISKIENE